MKITELLRSIGGRRSLSVGKDLPSKAVSEFSSTTSKYDYSEIEDPDFRKFMLDIEFFMRDVRRWPMRGAFIKMGLYAKTFGFTKKRGTRILYTAAVNAGIIEPLLSDNLRVLDKDRVRSFAVLSYFYRKKYPNQREKPSKKDLEEFVEQGESALGDHPFTSKFRMLTEGVKSVPRAAPDEEVLHPQSRADVYDFHQQEGEQRSSAKPAREFETNSWAMELMIANEWTGIKMELVGKSLPSTDEELDPEKYGIDPIVIERVRKAFVHWYPVVVDRIQDRKTRDAYSALWNRMGVYVEGAKNVSVIDFKRQLGILTYCQVVNPALVTLADFEIGGDIIRIEKPKKGRKKRE